MAQSLGAGTTLFYHIFQGQMVTCVQEGVQSQNFSVNDLAEAERKICP